MQAALFATVALSWGLTWYAIRLQLGPTPDVVAIFWRFLISAALLWPVLLAFGQARRARVRQHRWFALMGLCLFSGNFMMIYGSEHDVPSGLVSVVFCMSTVFNAFNMWIFEGVRPGRRVLLGSALGVAGVALLFAEQILQAGLFGAAGGSAATLRGVGLALGGTYAFSLGNLVSRHATADGTSLPNAFVRAMSWGVVFLGLATLAAGHGFAAPLTPSWTGALAYLVLIGTLAGFGAYLSLVARIGPARAAYVTVVSPLIALTLSSLLEGYAWSVSAMLGVPLILLGNLVIFAPVRPAASPAPAARR